MARFDKKWLLVHVPAGIAVVALMAFGIVQCNGNEEYSEELAKASAGVKQARQALESNVATMDSLIGFNKALLKINVAQADSIVVLNDSIDTLNGRVVELTNKNDSLVNANDSLVIALDDCAKSKQKKPIEPRQDKPTLTNKPKKAPKDEKQAVVKPVVLPTVENKADERQRANQEYADALRNPDNWQKHEVQPAVPAPRTDAATSNTITVSSMVKADEPKIDISVNHGAKNNGNVVVQNRGGCAGRANAQSVTISLDNNAENNGNIVVGNGNVVSHTTVLPDTVVRFTRAKNTVVKCRVIATQRQYR